MKRLTKIVATIGPASDSEETIVKLIEAGVNVFRFNFKHNTVEWHNDRIKRVNKVATELHLSIGILIDLQGPEIRINMPNEKLEIKNGGLLYIGEEVFRDESKKGFSITHTEIIRHLKDGQRLYADDGNFQFIVDKKGDQTMLISQSEGILKNRKSLNIPGVDFPFPVLVEKDFDGLQLAALHDVDYVALSFVRSANDLKVVKKEMEKFKIKGKLIAKIETQKALNNLDEIIEFADGVMVARGDLGVELPKEQVPYYQKVIIKKSIEKGIPVITATQMLQSMVENPQPTRAEVSDVANAVYDLTDAVMLSAETATGNYPVETVKIMRDTVFFNESKFKFDTRSRYEFKIETIESNICNAAYSSYLQLRDKGENIAGFLVFTQTGKTANLMSRYRPDIPIYSFTPNRSVCEDLTLNFGVYPYVLDHIKKGEISKEDVLQVINILKSNENIKDGDLLIVLHGDLWAVPGSTSTVRIVRC